MAWASIADVEAILDEDEEPIPASGHVRERLATNLEEATDVVQGYLGRDYTEEPEPDDGDVPGDVPGAVRRVVARVAMRGFVEVDASPGVQSETNTMGPFGYHINWSKEAVSGDFYLTDTDRLRLGKYRLTTGRTVGHVAAWSGEAGFYA